MSIDPNDKPRTHTCTNAKCAHEFVKTPREMRTNAGFPCPECGTLNYVNEGRPLNETD
jgi:hypothetical protein